MIDDLRKRRRHLFDLLDAVYSPIAAARFQKELAAAIMEAEDLKSKATHRIERSMYGLHNRICRSYGDAMVWNLIHRHTIRQLSSAEGQPPHLTGMSDVIDKYLDMVSTLAESGIYAFAPDLTNIIKIADVVVAADYEVPMLLEIKGELVYMMAPDDPRFTQSATILKKAGVKGRLARQLGKMSEATEYLATGSLKPNSGSMEKRALDVDSEIDHYWPQVEEAVQGALDQHDYIVRLNDRHRFWATKSEPGDSELPSELTDGIPQDVQLLVGCHLVALEDISPHVMPPFNWDMSSDCRFALMEGDVVVNNIIDLSLLEGHSYENATIIEAGVFDPDLGTDATFVDVDGEIVRMSSIHIYKMLYEFQKVDSVANFMLKSAIAAIELGNQYQAELDTENGETDMPKDV